MREQKTKAQVKNKPKNYEIIPTTYPQPAPTTYPEPGPSTPLPQPIPFAHHL